MSVVTRIRRSETLSVPSTPEEVWAVLTDVAAYPAWWPSTLSIRIMDAPAGLLGTEWEVRPLVGRVVRFRLEDLEVGCSLRLRFFDGGLEGPGGFHLTPMGDATRVTYAVDVLARGLDVAALSRVVPLDAIYGLRMRRVLRSLSRRLRSQRKRVGRPALEAALVAGPGEVRLDPQPGWEQAAARAAEDEAARVAVVPASEEAAAKSADDDASAWSAGDEAASVALVRVSDEAAARPHALEAAAHGGARARAAEAEAVPGITGSGSRGAGTRLARWLMDSPRAPSVPEPEPKQPPAPQTEPRSNFEIARAYVHALSTAADSAELIPFLEPDVVGEVFPSPVIAAGAIRGRDGILSAWLKSREMWRGQRFDLLGATGGSSQVGMEIRWTATSAVDTDQFRRGQPVEAALALFLKFNDQRIVRQRTYFCSGPPGSGQGSRDANSDIDDSAFRELA